MNPVDLVTPEMVEYCEQFKIIVVCGFAKTGKYPIAKKLAESLNRHLIVSDDFGIQDFETFKNISTLAYTKQTPVVIEGVLSFRLLRKGIQENTFHADFIKWMDNNIKDLPNGTKLIISGGRSKASFPGALREEVSKRLNGIHATRIVIDEAKFAEDCLIQESCSSFKTGRCSKQCKLYK